MISALSLISCNSVNETTVFAMDTVMELKVYGGSAEFMNECEKIIFDIESKLSVTDPASDIYMLNLNGKRTLDSDTAELIRRSIQICELTEGAFDITVRPLMLLWGFTTEEFSVPDETEIKNTLGNVGSNALHTYGDIVELHGREIDLGGIAKGYTSMKLYEYAKQNGIKSGIFNLGGNVRCIGKKPDGSGWNVAIRDPNSPDDLFAAVEVSDKAVVTSGGYQRYFEKDGIRYHHIMDAATGYPADSGLISVTVISDDDVLADALSTAVFVGGAELAQKLKQSMDSFEFILVDKKGTVFCSEGIADSVTILDPKYSLPIICR